MKSLHRWMVVCCALAVSGIAMRSPVLVAQDERPQIPVGERKAPRKKDAGPRAVAVLRMGQNGKTSLVPIAILMNGKFWDATAYKADPVPMALDSGTVYEAEQTGSSLGLFTVNAALKSNARNSEAQWIGTGAWHPTGSDEPKTATKADKAPVGIVAEDNGPPRLTHDTSAKTPPATGSGSGSSASSNTPSSNTPPASSSKPSGSSDSDEPPRLSKGSSTPPSAPPADSTPPASKASAKPESSKPGIEADTKSNIPVSDSGTAEANRPKLRRGKPAEYVAEEDVPGYSRPGAAGSPAKGDKAAEAKEPDVKLVPAISDASGPTPHSYVFEWLQGDEGDRRKQITALAKEKIQAYLAAQEKARITGMAEKPRFSQKPGQVGHPAKPASAKVSEPILENEQMTAYDLWNSNQPVIVYSAQAHMPPPPAGGAHSEVNSDLQYSVVLVAYPDIYNNLHTLYSGVTDKFHLDVTPKLDLVDAVDADGDNRGELLFRETSDMGSGWVIYRATADKLYKMFDSLNPE